MKVFNPHFRLPYLVSRAKHFAYFAARPAWLPAVAMYCLPPAMPTSLTYAVLMPRIEWLTWQEVLLEKPPLTPEQSLALVRSLAETLMCMEEQALPTEISPFPT